MHDERFFFTENLRAYWPVWWRVWMPSPSVSNTSTTRNAKGLARKTRAIRNILRGRPGRRPVSMSLYLEYKEYIRTAWSRMNLEFAKGSAALTWTCKHVFFYCIGINLSRQHCLKSDSSKVQPDPPSDIARMLSAMLQRADAYLSELMRRSGILSIHFGEHFSENQCRYTP